MFLIPGGPLRSILLATALIGIAAFYITPLGPMALSAISNNAAQAYQDEAAAFAQFSAACQELGPLDYKEDYCRNVSNDECVELTKREDALRAEYKAAIAKRDAAFARLPFFAPGATRYLCSERSRSGTPRRAI